MNKRYAYVLCILLALPILCLAQPANYFPIGLSFYGSGSDSAYELQLLDDLGINVLMDCDSIVFGQICGHRGAKTIKLIDYDGPKYKKTASNWDTCIWWGKILPMEHNYTGGWADSLPDAAAWHDTLRNHLLNIDSFYIMGNGPNWEDQRWAGIYFDEYNYNPPYWSNHQWSRVIDTILGYAHDSIWMSLDLPASLRDKFIYSAPTCGFCDWGRPGPTWTFTMPELVTKLEHAGVGIFDCDVYWFNNTTWVKIPKNYVTNQDSFFVFQDTCVNRIIRESDTCRYYFERDGSKIKWYALNPAMDFWFCQMYQDSTFHWENFWRWPTREEYRLQGWLIMSRGCKGVRHFQYMSNNDNPDAMANIPIPDSSSYNTPAMTGILYNNAEGMSHPTRTPRSGGPYGMPQFAGSEFDTFPQHRIYDWVKEQNDTLRVIGPYLAGFKCKDAFGVNSRNGQYSNKSYVTSVGAAAGDAVHGLYNYFEVGCFKNANTANDTDHFMLVNRYCLRPDTVNIVFKLNYRYPYRLYDVLHDSMISGEKPSRDTTAENMVRLLPGGGKLMKIIPLIQAPHCRLDTSIIGASYKELYAEQSIKALNCTIGGNSNVRMVVESGGSITLDSNFTLNDGSTLEAKVVPHIPPYYQFGKQNEWKPGAGSAATVLSGNRSTEEAINDNTPKVYSLSQNYPNPSRDRTIIKYQLPKRSAVSLSIYNITGQLVKRFDMGSQQPGYYGIRWDAGRAANGVYFYKLNAGSYQSVKKMMVMK